MDDFCKYTLNHESTIDPGLQAQLEEIDARLRAKNGLSPEQAAVGLLDLRRLRLAMLHPDRLEYAASVPKIAILLTYFAFNTTAALSVGAETRRELGLMIRASSNEMATRFSKELGLSTIQHVLRTQGFYDEQRGGGIWMGKHYGENGERVGDPVGDHSHAATIRQLLRFYLLLEQERLLSAEASRAMRAIFESPNIPHDEIKFVAGLKGRDVDIIRKWGSWEDWLHDSAVIRGPGRHYILVGLTHHARGDEYLAELARDVDGMLALVGK